jgi:hypothetical protein
MVEWVNGWMGERVNVWTSEWANVWMCERVNGWMGKWVNEWMGERVENGITCLIQNTWDFLGFFGVLTSIDLWCRFFIWILCLPFIKIRVWDGGAGGGRNSHCSFRASVTVSCFERLLWEQRPCKPHCGCDVGCGKRVEEGWVGCSKWNWRIEVKFWTFSVQSMKLNRPFCVGFVKSTKSCEFWETKSKVKLNVFFLN